MLKSVQKTTTEVNDYTPDQPTNDHMLAIEMEPEAIQKDNDLSTFLTEGDTILNLIDRKKPRKNMS